MATCMSQAWLGSLVRSTWLSPMKARMSSLSYPWEVPALPLITWARLRTTLSAFSISRADPRRINCLSSPQEPNCRSLVRATAVTPMTLRRSLLIADLDNTLYDWVTFFARAFSAMVDELETLLTIDRERLLDEFKVVHQR